MPFDEYEKAIELLAQELMVKNKISAAVQLMLQNFIVLQIFDLKKAK